MNIWALMLRDLPPTAQRLIARSQRISLPRGCSSETRLLRLRQALCHAATVRATYAMLDPALQAAVQDLRACRGGLLPDDLVTRYGPLRPWSQIAADLQPQSITEQLVLMGWLLLRPAAPHNPAHFLLPPELRRWLPTPLQLPSLGLAPLTSEPALALQLATVLLLQSMQQPLTLRQDGNLTAASLQRLTSSLPADDASEVHAAALWLWPLLIRLGLTSAYQQEGRATPAAARFLALPQATQLKQLHRAWIAQPQPDAWLRPLLIDERGIDWPLLRRRLITWAAALPAGQILAIPTLYPALCAAFGPLGDQHTHGFRSVDRAPWQPRRAQAIWEAALMGPLAWLGMVTVQDERVWRGEAGGAGGGCGAGELGSWGDNSPTTPQPATSTARQPHNPPTPPHYPTAHHPHSPTAWCLGAPGTVYLPLHALASAGRLAHWMETLTVDGDRMTLTISDQSRARAAQQGWHDSQLRELLERHAGPLPHAWQAWLTPQPALRLEAGVVLTADEPAVLDQLVRQRSSRRHGITRLAPGIALIKRDDRQSLLQRCARQGLTISDDGIDPHIPPAQDAGPLSPGESAALLLACAFYRQHAPADAPFVATSQTEQRLAANLTPALRRAIAPLFDAMRLGEQGGDTETRRHGDTETGSVELGIWGATGARQQAGRSEAGLELTTHNAHLTTDRSTVIPHPSSVLTAAIERKATLRIGYSATHGQQTERTIRPLRLEKRPTGTYLTAYCCLRRAERTFRVDRIVWLHDARVQTQPAASSSARPTDEVVGRIRADAPHPNNLDALHGAGIQPVAAHAVRVWIDDGQQLDLQFREQAVSQEALEDAVLDVGAVAFHELEHLRAPLVIDHIIADNGKHPVLLE